MISKKAENSCEQCPSLKKGIFCELASTDLKDVSDHKVTNVYKKNNTAKSHKTKSFNTKTKHIRLKYVMYVHQKS